MQFTGANLRLLRRAINDALGEIQNQIATCPDVIEYAADIDELEQERGSYERLASRVDFAIKKEEIRKGQNGGNV